jgi:large conductance mechanosensitive channel
VSDLLTEFRKFVMKGNLVEIAVAFILALYFKDVVDVFTNGIVLAFVAAIFGEPNFASITIGIGDAELLIGAFLNTIVNFVLVALVLFFVVKTYNAMKERLMRSGEEEAALTREGELLTEIRDLLAARR